MACTKVLVIACATTLLCGCMDGVMKPKSEQATFEDASKAKTPEKLSQRLDPKNQGDDANYVMSPLQRQLQELQEQAQRDRAALSQSQEKAGEYARRSQELLDSLKQTEARIGKVNEVIRMIEDAPGGIQGGSLGQPGMLAQGGGVSGVPGIGSSGPLGDALPALGQNSPLSGGPGLSPLSSGAQLPRNEVNSGLSQPTPAPAWNAGASTDRPSLSPLGTMPSFAAGGPELSEKPGAVWDSASAPAPRRGDGTILLCDGNGADMEFIISLGEKDGLKEGMLYEATSATGARNVLVVTRVYQTNAEARLHPRFASGGLEKGNALRRLNSLPE